MSVSRYPDITSALKKALERFDRGRRRFAGTIAFLGTAFRILTFIASIATLICLTIMAGYDISPSGYSKGMAVLRISQAVFLINILFNITLRFKANIRDSRFLKWAVDIMMLVTVLPLVYPHPIHPWIPVLERILYSDIFLFSVLAAYAVVELSYGIMLLMGQRTNPALMLSGSFLIFILIGSFLLMLPKCTYHPIEYIDSLFVATSAVCITGLTTIDLPTTFTPLGILMLALLIQIGGLGVLTFTSFFAIFFTGNTSIYSQMMIRDVVYTKSFNKLIPTLLYILVFSVVIEISGAALIWTSIHGELMMTLSEEIIFSLFHSLSAFCNAGFSTISYGLSNPLLLYGHQSFYLAMSLIIMAGSIGFPLLVNFKDAIVTYFRRLLHRPGGNIVHIWSMNTKIVLITFISLFVIGAVAFFILEYGNSLSGMPLDKKIIQSVFNSVTPRSAGFSSVNPAGFMPLTLLIIMALMWIGGSAQSTAGGMKVNTFAAMLLNIRTFITGRRDITAFKRTISSGSMRRANAILSLSVIIFLTYTGTLIALEPNIGVKELVFEACSAVFTVGSSLGITQQLSDPSKIVVCTAMFLGRVGVLSILMGFARNNRGDAYRYPTDDLIIN